MPVTLSEAWNLPGTLRMAEAIKGAKEERKLARQTLSLKEIEEKRKRAEEARKWAQHKLEVKKYVKSMSDAEFEREKEKTKVFGSAYVAMANNPKQAPVLLDELARQYPKSEDLKRQQQILMNTPPEERQNVIKGFAGFYGNAHKMITEEDAVRKEKRLAGVRAEAQKQKEIAVAKGKRELKKDEWTEPYESDGNLVQENKLTGEVKTIKKTTKEDETWSAPYKDESGNLVQRNNKTGKITILSREKDKEKELTFTNIESRIEHLKRSYGETRNAMNQILIIQPEQKKQKLVGWIYGRPLEKDLTQGQLDRAENAIMTEIGIPINVQHSIRAARMAGATPEQLEKLIINAEFSGMDENK